MLTRDRTRIDFPPVCNLVTTAVARRIAARLNDTKLRCRHETKILDVLREERERDWERVSPSTTARA